MTSFGLLLTEWAVKAMFPISGMRSVEQILKHSEAELACCGRGQFGNHDGQDGCVLRYTLSKNGPILLVH